jgi:ribonuclease J
VKFFLAKSKKLSIIPLGGIGEIGKNMFLIGYDGEFLIIDSGLMFPEDEMLGIDNPLYTVLLQVKTE